MQFGEVDAQVGHLEQVLHLLRVRIVNGQIGRKDAENDFSFGRWRHVRVARLADDFGQVAGRIPRDARKRFSTVVSEVAVHLSRVAIDFEISFSFLNLLG